MRTGPFLFLSPIMQLKTNINFHCGDDPHDFISYTLKEGIDNAARHRFDVLAVTCHNKVVWSRADSDYAAQKGLLLLPGIELNIREDAEARGAGKHIIILNCDADAEAIRTFDDLGSYRKERPNIFVLAPHPYFYGNFSLKRLLNTHIDLFDGIEHSWFYSRRFNRNLRAAETARAHGLPLIATSDTHYWRHFNDDYAIVDARAKTPEDVIAALRRGAVENISRPKRALTDMLIRRGAFTIKNVLSRSAIRWRVRMSYAPNSLTSASRKIQ